MPQIGQLVELALGVADADTDTIAAVLAHPPGGRPAQALGAYPDDLSRARWRANITPDEVGVWLLEWTVTGSGAGVQLDELPVTPPPPGRRYVTATTAAMFPDDDPPIGAASRTVDGLIRCAVYDVDDDGLPTGARVRAALDAAVRAQLAWWAETGDTGSGATAMLAGAQIGTVKLPGAGAVSRVPGGPPPGVAPLCWSALQAAGLTGQGPILPGRYGAVIRQGAE